MNNSNFFDDLANKITNAIPSSVKDFQKDIEKNIRAILHTTFNKLDLVTREEFDIQKGVLHRTRTKLEALEKHIVELEREKELSKKTIKEGKKSNPIAKDEIN